MFVLFCFILFRSLLCWTRLLCSLFNFLSFRHFGLLIFVFCLFFAFRRFFFSVFSFRFLSCCFFVLLFSCPDRFVLPSCCFLRLFVLLSLDCAIPILSFFVPFLVLPFFLSSFFLFLTFVFCLTYDFFAYMFIFLCLLRFQETFPGGCVGKPKGGDGCANPAGVGHLGSDRRQLRRCKKIFWVRHRHDTIRSDKKRYDTIRYDTTRHDAIRYDTIQKRSKATASMQENTSRETRTRTKTPISDNTVRYYGIKPDR